MTHCPDCHRLRRPTGMHICVPGIRGRTMAPSPAPGHDRVQAPEPEASTKHITRYRLPPSSPAAHIWNRTIDRRRNGLG